MYKSSKRKSSILTKETLAICKELSMSLKQNANVPTNLGWHDLKDVEYYTSGGNSYIYTASFNNQPVMIKMIKPEIQDDDIAFLEIDKEMVILSKLNHPNIVKLYGAGHNLQGRRFLVLEYLDGGTMQQMISVRKCKKGRIAFRNFRSKVWIREALSDAHAIAKAMEYCHTGIDNHIIMHRDLKPDNIGQYLYRTLTIFHLTFSYYGQVISLMERLKYLILD